MAVYVRETMQSFEWASPAADSVFELLWVVVGATVVGGLYHPPRPLYSPESLLRCLEACVEKIHQQFPAAHIVLAGDFNQMSEANVVDHTGLTSIVYQPTRGTNTLDRIFVSSQCYSSVRVVKAVLRSDHKAIVAHPESAPRSAPKIKVRKSFRKRTPAQNALLLQHLATMEVDITESINDCQSEFDQFYATAHGLLNTYYPERTITITSRDPEYITPDIKAKLRRKNRLLRAGRIEEADALAERIGTYCCLLYVKKC